MKKDRIFISSTYIDLIPHRKSIWELLQSFNVEISGMERFGARTEIPLQTCLDEVELSNIFIGVIGMRYGSIDELTGKSFSQLEYEKAVKQGNKILLYIIDDYNAKVTPKIIDFENHEKLSKFKELVSKKHTIEKFTTIDDLNKKINNDLRKLLSKDSIIPNYRPDRIKAEIFPREIKGEKWFIVLGLKYGIPFEIYVGNDDNPAFSLLDYPSQYWIVRSFNENGVPRYDFQFRDSDGYKVTIEGVYRIDSNQLISITSTLLEKEVEINKIIEILNEIDFDFGEKEKLIKKEIIEVLINKLKI